MRPSQGVLLFSGAGPVCSLSAGWPHLPLCWRADLCCFSVTTSVQRVHRAGEASFPPVGWHRKVPVLHPSHWFSQFSKNSCSSGGFWLFSHALIRILLYYLCEDVHRCNAFPHSIPVVHTRHRFLIMLLCCCSCGLETEILNKCLSNLYFYYFLIYLSLCVLIWVWVWVCACVPLISLTLFGYWQIYKHKKWKHSVDCPILFLKLIYSENFLDSFLCSLFGFLFRCTLIAANCGVLCLVWTT